MQCRENVIYTYVVAKEMPNISNTAEDSEPENFMSQKLEILDTDIQDALLAQTKEP
jgi:hypothetical protein